MPLFSIYITLLFFWNLSIILFYWFNCLAYIQTGDLPSYLLCTAIFTHWLSSVSCTITHTHRTVPKTGISQRKSDALDSLLEGPLFYPLVWGWLAFSNRITYFSICPALWHGAGFRWLSFLKVQPFARQYRTCIMYSVQKMLKSNRFRQIVIMECTISTLIGLGYSHGCTVNQQC